MKNNLRVNLVSSEHYDGDLSVNVIERQLSSKRNSQRDYTKPKIVIFPPIEDVTGTMTTPSANHLLETKCNRISRRGCYSNSMASSSSNESISEDTTRANDRSASSVSETSSDESARHRRHRSTMSLRRVFENLSLTSRSQSAAPSDRSRKPKKQKQPKCILRSPVTYTYVRGLSGLPTQRVPRYAVCCNSMGLDR